jgi:hypothetical protein
MNDKERFLDALDSFGQPICDDCITDLVPSWGQRQRAYGAGSALSGEGRISRGPGRCFRCGRTKTVSGQVGGAGERKQLSRTDERSKELAARYEFDSAESALAFMKAQAGVHSVFLDVSVLGRKGQKRFYAQRLDEDSGQIREWEKGTPLPPGAKEVTWEQVCEVMTYLKRRDDVARNVSMPWAAPAKGRALMPEPARHEEVIARGLRHLSLYVYVLIPRGALEPTAKEVWSKDNTFYLADFGKESQLVVVMRGAALELPAGTSVEPLDYYDARHIDHLRHMKTLEPKGPKKNHDLFWMLFAYASHEVSKSVSSFLKNGGR